MSLDEPELTALLQRLAPGFETQCAGATDAQIEELRRIAGRPLPPFYEWFLSTMGRDIGPFAKARQDLSVDAILRTYAERLVEPDSRHLLIAGDTNEDDPTLGFYDLDDITRGDAAVLVGQGYGGHLEKTHETFREMFARANLIAFRIRESPSFCRGTLTDPDRNVSAKIDAVTTELGFASALATGPYCKVLERDDMAMAGWTSPSADRRHLMIFHLGGPSEAAVRKILGEIALKTRLEIRLDQWGAVTR